MTNTGKKEVVKAEYSIIKFGSPFVHHQNLLFGHICDVSTLSGRGLPYIDNGKRRLSQKAMLHSIKFPLLAFGEVCALMMDPALLHALPEKL